VDYEEDDPPFQLPQSDKSLFLFVVHLIRDRYGTWVVEN